MNTTTLTHENKTINLSLMNDDVVVEIYENEHLIAQAKAYSSRYIATIEILFKNCFALEVAINKMLDRFY
jgi:S-adenosylmethionine hydrolase